MVQSRFSVNQPVCFLDCFLAAHKAVCVGCEPKQIDHQGDETRAENSCGKECSEDNHPYDEHRLAPELTRQAAKPAGADQDAAQARPLMKPF